MKAACCVLLLGCLCLQALGENCVVSNCYEGWVEYNGFCYGFSPERLDWFAAASSCQVYGSRLVRIESQAEQNWINQQLAARKIDNAWLGGTRRYTKSVWYWVPSMKPIKAYSNWIPGEPNNSPAENTEGGDNAEQCLEITNADKWNDRWCAKELYFICEKRIE